MSHHNPYGGTQADLIGMADDSLRLTLVMRELLTAIHAANLTDLPAQLQEQINDARRHVRLPDVTVKQPKPITNCIPSFFNNPSIRKPFP